MEQDRQAERLYRVATACKEMTAPLRLMSQDLGRMRLDDSDELIEGFRRVLEAVLSLERAALERMISEHPSHLMSDLAPREIEAIGRRRRELLANLAGRRQ